MVTLLPSSDLCITTKDNEIMSKDTSTALETKIGLEETAEPSAHELHPDPSIRRPSFLERIVAETKPIGSIHAPESTSMTRTDLKSDKTTTEDTLNEAQHVASVDIKPNEQEKNGPASVSAIVRVVTSPDHFNTETQPDVIAKGTSASFETKANSEELAGPDNHEAKPDSSARRQSFLERIVAEIKPIGSIYTSEPTSTSTGKSEGNKNTMENTLDGSQHISSTAEKSVEMETNTPRSIRTLVTVPPSLDSSLPETHTNAFDKNRLSAMETKATQGETVNTTINETKSDLGARSHSFLERIVAEMKPMESINTLETMSTDRKNLKRSKDSAEKTLDDSQHMSSTEAKSDRKQENIPESVRTLVTVLPSPDLSLSQTEHDVISKDTPACVERKVTEEETADPTDAGRKSDVGAQPQSFLEKIVAEIKPIESIYTLEPTATGVRESKSSKDLGEHTLHEGQHMSSTETKFDSTMKNKPFNVRTIVTVLPSTDLTMRESQHDANGNVIPPVAETKVGLEEIADLTTHETKPDLGTSRQSYLERIVAETQAIGSIVTAIPTPSGLKDEKDSKDTTEHTLDEGKQISPIKLMPDGAEQESPLSVRTVATIVPSVDLCAVGKQDDVIESRNPVERKREVTTMEKVELSTSERKHDAIEREKSVDSKAIADTVPLLYLWTHESKPGSDSQPKTLVGSLMTRTMPLDRIFTPETIGKHTAHEETTAGTTKVVQERSEDSLLPERKPDAVSKDTLTVVTKIGTTKPTVDLSTRVRKHGLVDEEKPDKVDRVVKTLVTADGSPEETKHDVIDKEKVVERMPLVTSLIIAAVPDPDTIQDASDKQKAVEVKPLAKTVGVDDPLKHETNAGLGGRPKTPVERLMARTIPLGRIYTPEIIIGRTSADKTLHHAAEVAPDEVAIMASPKIKPDATDKDTSLDVSRMETTLPSARKLTPEKKHDAVDMEKFSKNTTISASVPVVDISAFETKHAMPVETKPVVETLVEKTHPITSMIAFAAKPEHEDRDSRIKDTSKVTSTTTENISLPEVKSIVTDNEKTSKVARIGESLLTGDISAPETKDDVIIETIAETLGFDQPNLDKSAISLKSDSLNAGKIAAKPETMTSIPNKEEEYHDPTTPSFDTTIHAIKSSLKLEEIKPEKENQIKVEKNLDINDSTTQLFDETLRLHSSVVPIIEVTAINEPDEESDEEYFDAYNELTDSSKDHISETSVLRQNITETSTLDAANIQTTTIDDVNESTIDHIYEIITSEATIMASRLLSDVMHDIDFILSDQSLMISISDTDSTSDGEERYSPISNDSTLESADMNTTAMTTIEGDELLHSKTLSDIDSILPTTFVDDLTLTAELLVSKILALATNPTVFESNEPLNINEIFPLVPILTIKEKESSDHISVILKQNEDYIHEVEPMELLILPTLMIHNDDQLHLKLDNISDINQQSFYLLAMSTDYDLETAVMDYISPEQSMTIEEAFASNKEKMNRIISIDYMEPVSNDMNEDKKQVSSTTAYHDVLTNSSYIQPIYSANIIFQFDTITFKNENISTRSLNYNEISIQAKPEKSSDKNH
ncbi:unnamed protein product [Rotaria sp. Silwood1]|nr:unnamed protein product [Rotaria sp. Silwood1]